MSTDALGLVYLLPKCLMVYALFSLAHRMGYRPNEGDGKCTVKQPALFEADYTKRGKLRFKYRDLV